MFDVKSFSFYLLSIFLIKIYVIFTFDLLSDEFSHSAKEILVYSRIPHHALIDEWFFESMDQHILQLLIMILFYIYLEKGKFSMFYLYLSFWVSNQFNTYFMESNTLALMFPWRISVLLVPLSSFIFLAIL